MEPHGKKCTGAHWVIDWRPMSILKNKGVVGAWVVIDLGTRNIIGVHLAREREVSEATDALKEMIAKHGCPSEIDVDQTPEWRSESVAKLASEHRIKLPFIPSWSPMLKARVEVAYRRMANAIRA